MKIKCWTYLMLILAVLMVAGCAGLQFGLEPVCKSAPECSLICAAIPDPENQDLLIQLVNDELLYQDVYTAADAIAFLDKLNFIIVNATSYAGLISAVDAELNILPDRIRNKFYILSRCSLVLSKEIPICDFDRELLQKGIQNQKDVALKYL
ncbi:MAG: hypothetical protein PHP56_12705 [Smithellaceae bacterium]|nr:hypothetical protein [Smithellaceae bacterium]